MNSSQAEVTSASQVSTPTTDISTTRDSSTSQKSTTIYNTTTSLFSTVIYNDTTWKSTTPEAVPSISISTLTYRGTTNTTDGSGHSDEFNYSDGILAATILVIIVVSLFTISLIIYRQKQSRKLTSVKGQCGQSPPPEDEEKEKVNIEPPMYEDVESNVEISILPSHRANHEIEDSRIPKADCMIESNPYVECPSNVYDKAYIPRPHVYELQTNIYE
ncbi:uncharacterized protein LOC125646907 [Ostrea edulis]|uniref:uncharacterized protein LOC125646907 n=1 Tax=Ostrea edulis TaxID=37623 RepID=UPI0024AFA0AB|nr:uncharacterized protein LOC125646907 [Ostrea edulis]XP_048729465.2 uncharacterized protein LOC125646907 [Ostrea edulis]XP_048729466.2 uncharacterized protein LOC125646907 [Ostrea edulis]